MATSALDAAIDGLVTAFAGEVASDVTVFDGPSVTAQSVMKSVTVGADDVLPHDMRSGVENQEWASIGGVSKNARGTVRNVVVCQSGGTDIAALRNDAFAVLASCETALRNDIDLAGGTILYTGLDSIDLRQQQTADGSVVRIIFTVNYRARI